VDSQRALLFAALASTSALALALWWRGVAERLRRRARTRRAAEGELEAERLLERAGFSVRGRQVRASLTYRLDGQAFPVEVRADYVVERRGRSFVAEVKTGREAPRLRTPATRRQLLEYAHAFEAEGILLVDAERGRVHEVALPRTEPRSRLGRDLSLLALGAALGAIASLLLARA
jgi:hypothetical protein